MKSAFDFLAESCYDLGMAGNHPEGSDASGSEPVSPQPPAEAQSEPAGDGQAPPPQAAEGDRLPDDSSEAGGLPNRYVVRQSGDGVVIGCLEAPNIVVHVERGFTLSGAAARKAAEGSIFLDGVANDAPFLDTERHVYNLDHHEGCVRPFTLSTCEQAFILIRKGLNLREREWTLYANEPDLDTVLAIWVILNHRRINDEDDAEIRSKILPILRLEGVIDVHGFELQELACFSEEQMHETGARISNLIQEELAHKQQGRWAGIDYAEHTARTLRKIDEMIYSPWHFDGFKVIDEIARVEITDSQVAVICRSEAGIYEVEQQLREVHEDRLGIIVLQKSPKNYTLRQVNLFLPVNLKRVYSQLNLMDPNSKLGKEEDRWGGSGDIGGSPRKSGTGLSPAEIADALLRAFHKPTPLQVLSTAAVSVISSAIALLGGWAVAEFTDRRPDMFTAAFSLSSLFLLFLFARQYPRIYGLTMPRRRDWLLLLPAAVAAALLGGSWVPLGAFGAEPLAFHPLHLLGLALALPVGVELLFRGLVHGLWAEEVQAQRSGGRWFLSWPAVCSSLLYAAASQLPFVPRQEVLSLTAAPLGISLGSGLLFNASLFASAFLFGIVCSMVRERSESIVAPIVFHWICLGIIFAVTILSG